MTETVLPFQVFEAPETWRTVDFISDLHLQEKETATFEVWQAYMPVSYTHLTLPTNREV